MPNLIAINLCRFDTNGGCAEKAPSPANSLIARVTVYLNDILQRTRLGRNWPTRQADAVPTQLTLSRVPGARDFVLRVQVHRPLFTFA